MKTRHQLTESGKLSAAVDGVYPVRIITEGEGSSGIYSREMLSQPANITALENALSFDGHPADPSRPQDRTPDKIRGRLVGALEGKEVDGVYGYHGHFKPRKEYADFIAEYEDVLGLSIFIGAYGTKNDDGKVVVESFNGDDPYKSVDLVVAAGRGGRFERATEALQVLESALGNEEPKPGVTSAQESQEEGNMDPKLVEALTAFAALAPRFDAFLTAQEAAATAAAAEAEARAAGTPSVEDAVKEALASYAEKATAVEAAELLPSQKTAILAQALEGADVAPLIESAAAVVAEAKSLAESAHDGGAVLSAGATKPASDAVPKGW